MAKHVSTTSPRSASSAKNKRQSPALVALKGKRRRWVEIGNGIRQRQMTPAQAAYVKQRQAETRALEARIQADTCGMGHWQRPEGWDRAPYTHTVTVVDGVNAGFGSGWGELYNSGVVVTLVVHDPAADAFMRGEHYVWCKPTRNGNGDNPQASYPTACIFGRFIEKDGHGRAVALVGRGKRQTIDTGHSLCFRAVGHVYQGEQFYPRSEVPVPIPSEAVRYDGPLRFDCLQAAVKAMDSALEAMANVTEMVDELNEATGNAKDAYLDRRCREAAAYRSLDELLTTACNKQGTLREALAEFHKASPELAFWLQRWQAMPAEAV